MITVNASVEGIEKLNKSLATGKMSKEKLAKKAKIARSTVTNFFLGRAVQREKAELICQILGTNIKEIIIESDLHKDKIEHITDENTTDIDIEKIVQQVQSKLISGNEIHKFNLVRVLEMPKPIALDDIYVEVKVWDDFGQHNIGDQDNSNNSEYLGRIIKGLDAIKKYSRLMLLGQPGAGKTTFLRHIATLQNFNINKNGQNLTVIPILVILRDYAYRSKKRHGLNLFDYIKNELARNDISVQEFNTILQQGRAIFMLDGLDEVTDQENLDVCGEIIELLNDYPQNRFVISCRNAAEPFKLESFTEVQMSDFDSNQVRQFIENWFNVYLELYEFNQPKIREAKEKLIRQLEAQSVSEDRTITDYLRPIKDFTQTPLLLTMLCLIVTVKGEIPSGRLELYKKSVDIFLSEWDIERGIKRTNFDGLNKEQILTLLSDLALKTHLKQETIFSQLEIKNSIQKQNKLVETQAVISFIQSHYGILINSGFYHYSFFHKTFQEYFAALGIIKSNEILSYINDEHIRDAFWREVLILVLEFLLIDNINNGEYLVNEFIAKILKYILSILENNPQLNQFIKQVYDTVDQLDIENEKTKTSLRVFLSDPDYSFDSSRTLLMELDQSMGNKLVASSFISRLFCDENDNSIDDLQLFLRGFKIASNIPDIENADNADHALQIAYEYVKSQSYVIKYQNYILKTRKEKIKSQLDKIYSNSNSDIGRQAKECRDLCLEYLKLDKNLGLNISKFLKNNHDDSSYKYLYNATLLLIKSLKIIDQSSFSHIQKLYQDTKNYLITPATELKKLLSTIETESYHNYPLGERRFKGQLSDEYSLWQLARPHLEGLRREIKKLLIDYQSFNDDQLSILEVGCGNGELTEIILSEVNNIKIIAIDNEPSMINKIRLRLANFETQGKLEIIETDALVYLQQCQPNSFHLAISGFTFHNMFRDYRFQVLQKLFEVLLPKGKLLDVDKIAQRGSKHESAKKWQYDKFFEVLTPVGRFDLLKEVMLHYADDEQPERIRYEDEAISELFKIGFQDVTLHLRQYMDAIIVACK